MRTAIALGAFVALVGCDNKSPDVSTTQDNICDQVAQVACFDYFQCCSEGEIETFLNLKDPPTQTQCEDDTRTRCERDRAAVNLSIKNKRVAFDAKSMNTCLESFVAPSGTCSMIAGKAPWIDACMDAGFVGTVEAGGACDFGYECVKDTVCSGSRICTAHVSAGMPCIVINNGTGPTSNCASGLYCPGIAMPTCQPKLAQGAVCKNDVDCMDGLFCDSQDTQTCTTRPAVGQACSQNPLPPAGNTCGENTCLPGTCADTGIGCAGKLSCQGHCSNAPTTTCSADFTCNQSVGACSGTATPCTSGSECPVGSACVFPNKCMHPECTGAVCAEPHVTIDFCQDATEIPSFALPAVPVQGVGPGRTP
jgi:hypothetical protein